MTSSSEHDHRSPVADPGQGDAARLADAGRAEHDELRRTFARRIDCAVHEGHGGATRGGRRQPARGRGRGAGDDHAA